MLTLFLLVDHQKAQARAQQQLRCIMAQLAAQQLRLMQASRGMDGPAMARADLMSSVTRLPIWTEWRKSPIPHIPRKGK